MALRSINSHNEKDFLINNFLRGFNKCDYVWIAWNLDNEDNHPQRYLLDFFNKYSSFELLYEYIKNTLLTFEEESLNLIIDKYNNKKEKYLLKTDLNSLKTSHRLCWFLVNRFSSEHRISLITGSRTYKQIHNPYIFFLVIIFIYKEKLGGVDEIDLVLNKYIADYREIKNERNNLEKYINNKDFTEWSVNYIDKNFRYSVFPKIHIDTHELHQEYIYAYFDDLYIYNEEKYINDLNKLKKAWQQNVFRRKNKDNPKKSYHLPLKKESKKFLEKLAHFKNISETEVLEKLINEAYKKEMCNEKGKANY